MRPAEQQHEPHPRSGMGRMVVVSAVLHVIVIVFILVATSRKNSESSPRLTAHTVELVSPGVLGAAGGGSGGTKPVPVVRPLAEQKSPLPKPERKEPPVTKRPPEPPREKAEKVQVKEPPPPKTKEPPKVVAAKPPLQEPPAVKPKPSEPAKPKEAVKLPEKVKKPEPKKPENKPEPESEKAVSKTEKKPVEKEKPQKKPVETERKKSESSSPRAKEKETEERERVETQEREKQILAALERVRASEEAAGREKELAAALERVRKSVTEKEEEKGNAGTRHEGEGNAEGESGGGGGYGAEFLAYTQHIKQKVKEAWILAERRPGLQAVVRFGVEASGEVLEAELADSSGDRAFDQSALRAVRKASPFPPPPDAYREEFATQKVEITFSGEERIR